MNKKKNIIILGIIIVGVLICLLGTNNHFTRYIACSDSEAPPICEKMLSSFSFFEPILFRKYSN